MRIIDLTQPIHDGMAVYPGDPPIAISPACTLDRDGYAVYRLQLSDQVGTHVETQAHMIPGRNLDDEPLERFIGSAAVVDVPCAEITVAHLAPQEDLICSSDFVLLRSGYADAHDAIDVDDPHRPFLSPEAVDWIVGTGVSLLGIDCFDFDLAPAYEGHKRLFAANVVIVEGLVNLRHLGQRVDQLLVVPLLLQGTSGAPCRVFALEII